MNRSIITIATIVCGMLSGCAYNVSPYGLSSNNIEKIKALQVKPVSVAKFESTKPGLNSITCRAAGPVTVIGSFESYIEKAFIDELKIAGIYDASSPISIKGKLDEVDFNSNIGAGKWLLSLSLSSQSSPAYTVNTSYEFSTNFVADKACQQVAQNFGQAVQKLIGDAVSDPRFKGLIN